MIKRMKSDVKYVVFGVLIFALAMGFTFANYKPANAAGVGSDPLVTFYFGLVINQQTVGTFVQANNIGSETEVTEYKAAESSGRQTVQKVPGRLKFFDFTLKRGITSDMYMYKWRQMVEKGNIAGARKDYRLKCLH